jgi:hypothetical protein
MNWDAIGAGGEIVGGSAVVLTGQPGALPRGIGL